MKMFHIFRGSLAAHPVWTGFRGQPSTLYPMTPALAFSGGSDAAPRQ